MNDSEINLAIAEACGWKYREGRYGEKSNWERAMYNTRSGRSDLKVPDYAHDLNAMHGAINTLSREQVGIYGKHLRRICGSWDKAIFKATAGRCAEAFLRTLGKWKE